MIDIKSKFDVIDIGIPQGSILGPFLFLIYINDLPNASNFYVKLFTDDTFLSLSGPYINELNTRVNIKLEKIHKWFEANNPLNVGKS